MNLTLTVAAWDWPMIARLFGIVALSCLFSFGGGNGPVILIQNRLVDTGILGVGPFAFLLGFVQMLPGPKAAFVAGVGYYLAGFPGAVAATLGLVIPTVLLSAVAHRALVRLQTITDLARPALGYVLAGIIGATAYSTSRPLDLGMVEVGAIGVIGYLVAWRGVEALPLILAGLAVGAVRAFTGLEF